MVDIKIDNVERFEISDDIKSLSKNEKLDLIKAYFKNEYQGKTVKYEILGEEKSALINVKTAKKYKDRGYYESGRQYRVRLNIGASNEFMTLIDNAQYNYSLEEAKKDQNPLHHNTEKWHYFVKPILCDEEYYRVNINVRQTVDGEYKVYGVTLSDLDAEYLKDEKEREASTPVLDGTEYYSRLSSNDIIDSEYIEVKKDESVAYTLDEIYDRAEDKAHLSAELKAKDEALWEIADYIEEKSGDHPYRLQEANLNDSAEEMIFRYIEEHGLSPRFNDMGSIVAMDISAEAKEICDEDMDI